MNIRSLSNPAAVMGKEKIEASKTIKPEDTEDREANGQQPFSDSESHRELTDEEAQEVLEKLRSNESIKDSELTLQLDVENNQKIIKIIAPDGNIVKRFTERDLYFILQEPSTTSLRLVDKAA